MKLYRCVTDDAPGAYCWFPTRDAAEAETARYNWDMAPPLMRVEEVAVPSDDPRLMCALLNEMLGHWVDEMLPR